MNDEKTEDLDQLLELPVDDEDAEKLQRLKVLAKRIIDARQQRGLSLEALAFSVGISKGNLSDIENLKRNPRYTTLVAIAEGLNLSVSELLRGL